MRAVELRIWPVHSDLQRDIIVTRARGAVVLAQQANCDALFVARGRGMRQSHRGHRLMSLTLTSGLSCKISDSYRRFGVEHCLRVRNASAVKKGAQDVAVDGTDHEIEPFPEPNISCTDTINEKSTHHALR